MAALPDEAAQGGVVALVGALLPLAVGANVAALLGHRFELRRRVVQPLALGVERQVAAPALQLLAALGHVPAAHAAPPHVLAAARDLDELLRHGAEGAVGKGVVAAAAEVVAQRRQTLVVARRPPWRALAVDAQAEAHDAARRDAARRPPPAPETARAAVRGGRIVLELVVDIPHWLAVAPRPAARARALWRRRILRRRR